MVLDTLGAGHVSHLGYDRLTTPRIDALAADGVSFEQAIAPASYTVASIPSLLTGRLPDRHGLTWYDSRLPQSEETIAELYRERGYSTFAAMAVFNGSPKYGTDQGFEEVRSVWVGPGGPEAIRMESRGETVHMPDADEVMEIARERIEALESGEKLFLYLHFLQPHGPYYSPLEYRQHFSDERYPGPYVDGECAEIKQRTFKEGPTEKIRQAFCHIYDASILWVDTNVGGVLDTLRERDLYENALVAVTADHGESFWEHGHLGHGKHLYEEYVRVPMVVKLPGPNRPRGLRVPAMVSLMDLVPSLCDWSGLRRPVGELDGRSLDPFLSAPDGPSLHESLLLRGQQDVGIFALRFPRAKVVVVLGEDEGDGRPIERTELYDLLADEKELKNRTTRDRAGALRGARLIVEQLEALEALEKTAATEHDEIGEAERAMLDALGYVDSGEEDE
jgi:arylsulfatase A-like enzyme